MKGLLIIGVLGVALIVLTPVLRALRLRPNARKKDDEYFAAARKRALSRRLANAASGQRQPETSGDE
jgi:hypothetical protein